MAAAAADAIGGAPVYLGQDAVTAALPPAVLLDHLAATLLTLSPSIHSPTRPHYPIGEGSQSLLLMPSWSLHPHLPYIGVKVVTLFPSNSTISLPSVHASYLLFHSLNGRHLAILDGPELTLRRTSALAALAAKLLARPGAQTLALVGAGSLAPHLARAHLAALPSLRRVLVWNRTAARARALADDLRREGFGDVAAVEDVDEAVSAADVVACATAAGEPLVRGGMLRPGAHLGLIGSASPAMRECDEEALRRGRVFVDCPEAMDEAGELVGAFASGVIGREQVGMVVEVMKGEREGRRSAEDVTVFKSVGFAVLDLLAAQLVYEKSSSPTSSSSSP